MLLHRPERPERQRVSYLEWLMAGPYGYETFTLVFDSIVLVALTISGGYLITQALKEAK